jgi:hypothetical protein
LHRGPLSRAPLSLRPPTGDDSTARDAELERLRAEREKIDKALYRQSPRLEEQDDPSHPIVRLATQRIEELNGQAEAIALTVGGPEKQRPAGPNPAEVKAALDAVPDLSKTLENAPKDELTELLDAFDVSVSYDKPAKRLELSAVIAPDLDPEAAGGRSVGSFIAGAGFEPTTFSNQPLTPASTVAVARPAACSAASTVSGVGRTR